LWGGSSISSDESEWGVDDFWGEVLLRRCAAVLLREVEVDEVLFAVGTPPDGGWVVRARDERRGDIAGWFEQRYGYGVCSSER
jgi:hypothetical protein